MSELKKIVKPYSVAPEHVFPTKPVGKPIPTGKRLVFINCGVPSCVTQGAALTTAAKVLGWTVTNINVKPTPEGLQAGFEHALSLHPDGVSTAGFSADQYPKQAAKLKAAGIPIISVNSTDITGQDGVALRIIGPEYQSEAAALLADQALIDAGGSGGFLSVLLSGYPILVGPAKAFHEEIAKRCPSCKRYDLTIQPTALGTTAAATIANYLRAHPGIKGAYFTYDLMAQGLKQAVASTGGTYPNTYSWDPDEPGLQALATGERSASAALDQNADMWQSVDAFARLFTGQTVAPDDGFQQNTIWSKKYGNVPTPASAIPVLIKDYQDQFKQLWGK